MISISLKNYLIIWLILTGVIEIKSQVQDSSDLNKVKSSWFISVNSGVQMSGIKDEDFVGSNYSPLLKATFGKWISPLFAFQIGYKGFYFNYIEDDVKHQYNYFYGETLFNLNNAVQPNRENKNWNLLLHSGAGYFLNQSYNKSQLCLNIGIENNYQLSDRITVNIDLASIIGWRIYQGDEDILPGITVGFSYIFIFE